MEIVRLTAELATLGERVILTTGLEPIVLLHRDPIRMNWHFKDSYGTYIRDKSELFWCFRCSSIHLMVS